MSILKSGRLLVNALLAPQTCVICDAWVLNTRLLPLCEPCRLQLPLIRGPVCQLCGLPLPGVLEECTALCSRCRDEPSLLSGARSWGLFEGTLRDLLHAYKFGSFRRLSWTLSELLQEVLQKRLSGKRFDSLIAVPSHPSRIRQRGFDAAGLLAKKLSVRCGIPLSGAFERIRPTDSLFGLSRRERLRCLKGAFRARPGVEVPEGNLLIVDDILTTGTTLGELSSVIRRCEGSRRLWALTVARTPLLWS